MKRILTAMAAACVLCLSSIGCHHTAGCCDCIAPPHVVVSSHPYWKAPKEHKLYSAPAKHLGH